MSFNNFKMRIVEAARTWRGRLMRLASLQTEVETGNWRDVREMMKKETR